MASFSQTIIIGNLGRDPESKFLASGDAVCNFSVAVTESWKDKQTGEKKEETEWFRCNVFGKLAEICGQYLAKGSQVQVVGKMKTRKWTDQSGVEKYSTELRVEQMTMLGGRQQATSEQSADASEYKPAPQRQPAGQTPHGKAKANAYQDLGDDIPF